MTMRRWLQTASFLAPMTLMGTAFAEGTPGNCPPGSWFCEEVDVPPPVGAKDAQAPAASGEADDLATDADQAPLPKKKKKKKKKKAQPPPEEDDGVEVHQEGGETVVVVKQKPGQRVVIVKEGEAGGEVDEPYVPEPAFESSEPVPVGKSKRKWRETFGLNLRLEGAAFFSRYTDGGLGGLGASFRWRPSGYFALDVGTDIVGGVDYNGDDRVEVAGSVSGIVYFNPQHRFQVYGIGGVHLSHAEVDTTPSYFTYYDPNEAVGRDYLGVHGGLGLEWRFSRHVGLMFDALALVRRKIDDGPPEFFDPATGDTTDTSGAGLFRAGVNFWW